MNNPFVSEQALKLDARRDYDAERNLPTLGEGYISSSLTSVHFLSEVQLLLSCVVE